MKTPALAWRYLWSRPLAAVLNLLLLSLGLASISFLLLVGAQLGQAFERDLAGIDAVVGAKGSPMQLILCGVFHLDVPTGNIPLQALAPLQADPMLASVIPLSLGDNLQGFRIVGTTPDYIDHYGARLAQGRLWDAPMQVVLGGGVARQLGLRLGDRFAGAHGLGEGGAAHGDHPYTVVGILQPAGSVIDRLVVTDTASVWAVHAGHDAHEDEAHGAPGADAGMHDPREVTLALVRYRTPLAAIGFARRINASAQLQAAVPAVEITRLLHMLGVGTDVLRAFAGVLLLTAGLGVFIALWSAVRERGADLALLRMLGAPPARIAALLLGEALWLALLATLLGLAAGQALDALLLHFLQLDHALPVGVVWPLGLLWVPALACGVALASAALPALGAYRTSVLALLQGR